MKKSKATPQKIEISGEEFSVVSVWDLDPDYRQQPQTDHFCCLCQRDIKSPKNATGYVHYVHGGDMILSAADDARYMLLNARHEGGQLPGEMGYLPIGPECAKKLPPGFVHI